MCRKKAFQGLLPAQHFIYKIKIFKTCVYNCFLHISFLSPSVPHTTLNFSNELTTFFIIINLLWSRLYLPNTKTSILKAEIVSPLLKFPQKALVIFYFHYWFVESKWITTALTLYNYPMKQETPIILLCFICKAKNYFTY